MKKKLIIFLFLIVVLFVAPRVFNYLSSIGDTPQITYYDEREEY